MSSMLPALLLGIVRLGYRGPIPAHALSSLISHAEEHGVETVLAWIEEDSGLLLIPTWQFVSFLHFDLRSRRSP